MSKKQKKAVVLVCVGALAVVLVLPRLLAPNGATSGMNATSSVASDQSTQVRMEVVRSERFGGTITAVGTLLSNEEVEVRSQVSGQIRKIYFTEGRRVKKGELLVKIIDDDLQAQLLRARSRQAIAEQQAERQRQLFEKEFISQEEYNNVMNELNVARAETQLIRAQIDKTEIRASFDGTIGLRYVSEGSYVSPTTIITTLQDNSRMKVDFTIPEKYSSDIKVGDRIAFSIQTRRERFAGNIYSLDARLDQTTRTLRVRALAPNPEAKLLPGSFTTIDVTLNERRTLTIPTYALIPELRGHKVFMVREGRAVSQPVEIGTRTHERVEILDGLKDGDTLITSAILQLRPGTPVKPVENRPVNRP
jgi:membrane fusion protein (multidrug efflux system)